MSYRRSLSFAEDEKELLDEFDSKGKSDFAKEAMNFFLKYRDKVITDGMLEIFKVMGNSNKVFQTETQLITSENKNKLGKLIR